MFGLREQYRMNSCTKRPRLGLGNIVETELMVICKLKQRLPYQSWLL